MDVGYLLDGTPVAQEPQDEQTDPTRLLRSLSPFCLGFVFTRDVVVAPHVALPVVARTHFNNVLRCSTGPTGSSGGNHDAPTWVIDLKVARRGIYAFSHVNPSGSMKGARLCCR
jgi:hypothetical protein